MKSLLTLPLVFLLSGCVTYYYPQTALEDGIYYAEDDPSYVTDSGAYGGYPYYPWSSLDYFYLGYYPYARYGVGYGYNYGYGSGWSVGFSYAFSPWHYPSQYGGNYGHYSPWYASRYYPHYPAWQPYNGYYYNSYSHGNNKYYRNYRDYSYAGAGHGNGKHGYRNQNGGYSDDASKPAGHNSNKTYSNGRVAAPVRKYVSTTPSGYSGNRGMEVRSRGSKSTGRTTKQPIRNNQPTVIRLDPSFQRSAQNQARSRQSTGPAGEVRYRAGAKQGRTRSQPIESAPYVRGVAIATAPARPVASNGNGGRSAYSTPVYAPGRSTGKAASAGNSNHASSGLGSGSRSFGGRSTGSLSNSSLSSGRVSTRSSSSHRQNRK